MSWKTEYPTLATIKVAHAQTLQTWLDNLPAPQTDVEKTVYRRIEKRLFDMAAKECREKEPEIAKKWNELADKIEGLGLGSIGRM